MEVEQIQAIATMLTEGVKITKDGDTAYLSLESSGGNIACMTLANPEIWDEGHLQSSALWIIAQMVAEKVVPVVIQQERERVAKAINGQVDDLYERFREIKTRKLGDEAVSFVHGKREGLLNSRDIAENK